VRANQPIVVGIDGTAGALRAVRWGAEEAAKRHAPLRLVHAFGIPDAFPGEAPPPEEWLADKEEQSHAWLAEARGAATVAHPGIDVSTESVMDAPVPLLIAESAGARMIVLGSTPRSVLGDLVMGSTPVALAAHAGCPVAVIRGRDRGAEAAKDPVVVGIDGSPLSDAAIGLAFEEASLRAVSLITIRAYTGRERIADANQGAVSIWREKYPDVRVQQIVARDDPRRQLLESSERAQLVVVGSRGRGGFSGLLLGSTSHAMIYHADCPVFIARSEPGK
jgi:nucleotide-binding universal stress UspA family protein